MTLLAWGSNYFGQLGLSNKADCLYPQVRYSYCATSDLSKPIPLGNMQVTRISCSGRTSAVITKHGTVYCWGSNPEIGNCQYPRLLAFPGHAVDIACCELRQCCSHANIL